MPKNDYWLVTYVDESLIPGTRKKIVKQVTKRRERQSSALKLVARHRNTLVGLSHVVDGKATVVTP